MKRWLCVLVAVLCSWGVVFRVPEAGAQGEPPRISASVDTREVAVGETFTVTLDISSSSDGQPADPRIKLPPAMQAGSPSTSQRSEISIVNGRMSRSTGYQIAWDVLASREGTFTVGPPSVQWNGRRYEANSFTVVVQPAGSASRGQRGPFGGRRTNPLDPFGMFPHLPGFFEPPTMRAPEVPLATDPELQLEAAPDPNVFLRGIPSSRSAVVGEQITFIIYIYVREALLSVGRDPSPKDAHGPALADFFRRELDAPDAQPEQKTVEIAGTRWRVFAVDRAALFPLHAGDLPIGSMRLSFPGLAGAVGMRTALVRESAPVEIHVTEPPLKGRPAGYQIGDVGSYSLTASVDPRATEVGGAIGVTAVLKGTGNLPAKLHVPMQSSVEWLEPQVRENLEVARNKVAGTRTFTYLVRPRTAGNIDLGTIALPFYNPEKPGYEVAKVALGKVTVAPSKAAAPADSAAAEPQDPFRTVGPLREKRGAPSVDGRPWTDSSLFWILLFGAPLSVVAFSWADRAVRAAAARMRQRGDSPERGIEQALAQAHAASAGQESQAMMSSLERALYLAIERATGVRARGVLLEELPSKLEQAGLERALGTEAQSVLSLLERARFTPDPSFPHREVLERGDRLVRALGKKPPPSRGSSRGAGGVASAAMLALACFLGGARASAAGTPAPLASAAHDTEAADTVGATHGSTEAADADSVTFEQGVADLKRGDYNRAIEVFEALADRGEVHPDASYNRALAYLGRVRAGAERPGDLGRAAAGFEETLLLRPDDPDAELALESVRAEVARRRARGGADVEVEARPSLDRALIGLAPERTWAGLAILASVVLTMGLVARALSRRRALHAEAAGAPKSGEGGPARVDAMHLVGMIAVPIGALLLVLFTGLVAGAQHLRKTTQDGVVVVREVRLTDERGAVLAGAPIPEGARVELSEQRGGLVRVRRGTSTGWASLGGVRRLVRP